ncbi:hypothetical protein JXA70_05025 [candidate division KSB1 bacterium]|nr:hypothetical protein [candidate division KSB1 bacterium]
MNAQDTTAVEQLTKQNMELLEIIAAKFPATICLIALMAGLLIIFVGYKYSAGLYNKKELTFSIFISSLIGTLTAPLLLKLAIWLGVHDSHIILGIIFIIEIIFVAAVSSHAYEMVTVTAREAQARIPK